MAVADHRTARAVSSRIAVAAELEVDRRHEIRSWEMKREPVEPEVATARG